MLKIRTTKLKAEAKIPTKYGEFTMYIFKKDHSRKQDVVLVKGQIKDSKTFVPLRIHSSCITGDIFGSLRCDCGKQLETALKVIQKKENGILIYLDQEGRGIGLVSKLKAYVLQDQGLDTVEANLRLGYPADLRTYSSVIDILKHFKVDKVEIMTNNPDKIDALKKAGIKVRRHPLWVGRSKHNRVYLATKLSKMNHMH
jgi:3,4-dihydroxy 2-butanone 4-phosphate synthase/GTP cyclohydrolase II